MPEQKDALFNFMKKQISEKSTKKTSLATNNFNIKTNAKKNVENKSGQEEELTEEEQLEEAKKLSNNKAAQRNNAELLKKMVAETASKYLIIISLLAILAFAVIEGGPAIGEFLNGLISRALLGAITKS